MKRLIDVALGFILVSLVLARENDINLSEDAIEYHLEPDHLFGAIENGIPEKENRIIGFFSNVRPKRIVENLLLKVFVVIDYSLYQKWLKFVDMDVDQAIANIRYFYAHLVNRISKKYESIDTGSFKYKVSLSGYFIAQTLNHSMFTESEDVKTSVPAIINFNTVLKKLEIWVAERSDVIRNYGVVAAFTTYRDTSAAGMAYVGRACTGGGVSISYSGMLYSTVNIAAHEIGHNLGSKHDGEGNDCDPKQYFLMTPIQSKADITNYDTFSRCSRDYFEKYITSLNSTLKEKCFKVEATPMDEEVKKYLAELPGQRYTPDQSCQHQYGRNSFYCSSGAQAHLEICQDLSCLNPNDDLCYSFPDGRGLDGTPCGNKTWCLNKQCVYDERAQIREEYCMFGESKDSITFNNVKYYCSDLLKDRGLCYYDFFEDYCCQTCSNLADNGSADCKYGDKSQSMKYGNISLTCADFQIENGYCYIDSFRAICCKTCKTISTTYNSATCPYGDRIYSLIYGSQILKCPDFKQYPFLCYDSSRNSKCCKTCEGLKTNEIGCEYGDKSSYCPRYMEQYGPNICKTSAEIKAQCCKTCSSV